MSVADGITIQNRSGGPVVDFAVAELTRYLARLAPGLRIEQAGTGGPKDGRPALQLGLFEDFGNAAQPWPSVDDHELDDAIVIETAGTTGIIAGSNPRSVLLATYRYLTELGCRWVRPGPDGEYLPSIDLASSAVRVEEQAAYRHRGICIEGAVSYEHVRDLLDWMPRVGLNSYFTQFLEAYTFFERWYAHRGNPTLAPETFTVDDARALKARVADEIARRGLVFHDVGHGWTCEPLGIPGLGWEYTPPEVPPAVRQYLAEVHGQRDLWGGIPLNTQLCYSNPEVQRLIVDYVITFAREHPEVVVLHFWLGDGTNNHCECAACQQARPADWYVRLLNEIDERLTDAALPVRIVFLVYVDLLWPPETERLRHPERFILMFAPISRTYSVAYVADEPDPGTPLSPYVRNQLQFPRSPGDNLAFLRAWQRLFDGDSFDFDYHLCWDYCFDPGEMATSQVLHADIKGLAALDLNGLISCQAQRVFFPSGLAMAVLGQTLWDTRRDFQTIVNDHFRATFGADWQEALAYSDDLSRLFDPPYLRGEKPAVDPAVAATYDAVPAVIDAFRPVIQRNLGLADPCQARSWHYLNHHASLYRLLAEALQHRAADDREAAQRAWERALRYMQKHETDLQSVFDVYWVGKVYQRFFRAA